MKDRHLFISLNSNSWGSATMARTIADELAALGDEVLFLVHQSLSPVMSGAAFRCQMLPEHMGPLSGVFLESALTALNPTNVVLADYFGNANFLYRMGVNPEWMLSNKAVTFAIDPWHLERTGYEVDTGCGRSVPVGPDTDEDRSRCHRQFEAITHKMKPVPMVAPFGSKECFCTLPALAPLPAGDRSESRQRLGLSNSDKAVLFCTNGWQHPEPASRLKRIADTLPILLAEHISRLGCSVHLVHVGPQAYCLEERLDGRYHWLPPLARPDFDALISSMDLMVSANISATTIAKAMMFGVPVVVLRNSVSAATRSEAEAAIANKPSASMEQWLDQALPLSPFALWPIGFHRFLAPLLQNNPYVAALQMLEILDEQRMEATFAALLFDRRSREDQLHRQDVYLNQVRELPSGAQAIKAIC